MQSTIKYNSRVHYESKFIAKVKTLLKINHYCKKKYFHVKDVHEKKIKYCLLIRKRQKIHINVRNEVVNEFTIKKKKKINSCVVFNKIE